MPVPDTQVMTADVPAPLAEQVDALAARVERSRAWVVRQALMSYVETEERRYRQTLEGMADVDAGRGVAHDEVKAWAASLVTDKPLPLPSCK